MLDLEVLGRHALLVVSVLALAGTGWRLVATAVRRGADDDRVDGHTRALAAATAAATLAVLQALLLGLAGLGSSPVALSLAALLTYAGARATLPAEPLGLRAWWSAVPPRACGAIGATAGLLAAWTAWQLRYPHISVDGLTYHLSLVASWMSGGHVGAATELLEGVPVGNYPITHEVLLAWATGIAGSWAPAVVAGPLLLVLLGVAVFAGLRAVGLDDRTIVLAAAALATLPLVAGQLNAVTTDLPALTWLVVTGALAAASVTRSPALLPFALLAAGLAVGTKTTAVVLAGAVIALALVTRRADLRPLARPLTLAVLAALGTAAVWPLRNLLDHGSPLWPFQAWPGGDPVPPAFAAIDDAFADHPRAMLAGRVDDYVRVLGGGWIVLLAALTVPLLARDRRALVASAVTLAGLVAWATAPYTGIASSTDLAVGATRYLLPCLGAAVVATALSARGAARPAALTALALAVAWSLARDTQIGFPLTPGVEVLVVGAVAGAAAATLVPVRPLVAALPVAATLALAVAAPAIVDRHPRTALPDAALISALNADPAFDGPGRDIAMAPATVALAAGDRVQHDLQLIPSHEPCDRVRARLSRGWIVLQRAPRTPTYDRLRACLGARPPVHADPVYELFENHPAQSSG